MITGMLDGAAIPIRNTAHLREVVNRADAFLNCTAFIWKITSGKITAYKKHLGFCRNVRGKNTHTQKHCCLGSLSRRFENRARLMGDVERC